MACSLTGGIHAGALPDNPVKNHRRETARHVDLKGPEDNPFSGNGPLERADQDKGGLYRLADSL